MITFEDNAFAGLEIADNLNQRIVIVFDAVDVDSPLTPEDFDFSPPEGVDLFIYDE